ncbi:MAG: lipopolysaccharide export system protein LptA [Pseudomonadota bacterium]|nr:lipopolysaccharide export system protein LptA [Pseudomonadota bacterium]
MRHQNNYLNKLLLLSLLATPGLVAAKTSDAGQPVYIEADQVEIRDREGLSIYRGNVRIVQGSLRISGDEIRIHSTDAGLQRVHVTGKPANFFQLTDLDEEISATGEEMEYQPQTSTLTLDRNAVLVQRDNRFTSEHIVYNTQTNIMTAGPGNGSGTADTATPPRVTITIMPEKAAGENKAPENTTTDKPDALQNPGTENK